MIMELIEKKNKPLKTKFQFTKKEWEKLDIFTQSIFKNSAEASAPLMLWREFTLLEPCPLLLMISK